MFKSLDSKDVSRKYRRFRYLEMLICGCIDGELNIGTLRKATGKGDFPVLDELVPPYLMNIWGEAYDRLVYFLREAGFDRAKIKELRSSNEWKSAFAAHILGLMKHKPAVPALIKSAKSSSYLVSFSSMSSLVEMGENPILSDSLSYAGVARHGGNLPEPLIEMIAAMDKDLISAVEDNDLGFRTKQVAMEALCAIGCYRAAKPILKIGRDTESYPLKVACIRALGELCYLKGVPFLLECLEDESWTVRSEVVKTLGRMGGISLTAVAAGRLSDENQWVRYNSARTLSSMGELGIKTLNEALYKGDKNVVEAAYMALSEKQYFRTTI